MFPLYPLESESPPKVGYRLLAEARKKREKRELAMQIRSPSPPPLSPTPPEATHLDSARTRPDLAAPFLYTLLGPIFGVKSRIFITKYFLVDSQRSQKQFNFLQHADVPTISVRKDLDRNLSSSLLWEVFRPKVRGHLSGARSNAQKMSRTSQSISRWRLYLHTPLPSNLALRDPSQ